MSGDNRTRLKIHINERGEFALVAEHKTKSYDEMMDYIRITYPGEPCLWGVNPEKLEKPEALMTNMKYNFREGFEHLVLGAAMPLALLLLFGYSFHKAMSGYRISGIAGILLYLALSTCLDKYRRSKAKARAATVEVMQP
jgi:hypothetical protein